MFDFQNLVKEYGDHSFGAAFLLSVVFWILFIIRYVSGQAGRSTWTKLLDVIFMFFYIALFALYIMVGVVIGNNMFASSAIGTGIGIGAFWLMFEILAYIKKKRMKV